MSRFFPEEELGCVAAARLREPASSLFWKLAGRVEQMARDEVPLCGGSPQDAERLLNAAFLARLKPTPAVGAWLVGQLSERARRVLEGKGHTPAMLSSLALGSDLSGKFLESSGQALIHRALEDFLIPLAERVQHDVALLPGARMAWQGSLALACFCLGLPAPDLARLESPVEEDGSSRFPQEAAWEWLGAEMWRHEVERRRCGEIPFPGRLARTAVMIAHAVMARPGQLFGGAVGAGGGLAMASFGDSDPALPPPMEWLAWIAARAHRDYPREAGVARWLLETLYFPGGLPHYASGLHPLEGFVLQLWPEMATALSPREAGFSPVVACCNGDTFARPSWESPLRVALRRAVPRPAGGHGDANSFIVSYRETVLLADAGQHRPDSLYHELAAAARHHNTCTFEIASPGRVGPTILEQERVILNPVRGEATLHFGDVSLIASEAAAAYGSPISRFERIWLLAGEHVLIVLDHIEADVPVIPRWHLFFENDGLDLKLVPPDRLVARRGVAGMKLFFQFEGATLMPLRQTPVSGSRRPLASAGEGVLVGWRRKEPSTMIQSMQLFCFDTPGEVAGWHLRATTPEADATLENRGGTEVWRIKQLSGALALTNGKQQWEFTRTGPGRWR